MTTGRLAEAEQELNAAKMERQREEREQDRQKLRELRREIKLLQTRYGAMERAIVRADAKRSEMRVEIENANRLIVAIDELKPEFYDADPEAEECVGWAEARGRAVVKRDELVKRARAGVPGPSRQDALKVLAEIETLTRTSRNLIEKLSGRTPGARMGEGGINRVL
jgi:chromosome segregation ATPase